MSLLRFVCVIKPAGESANILRFCVALIVYTYIYTGFKMLNCGVVKVYLQVIVKC